MTDPPVDDPPVAEGSPIPVAATWSELAVNVARDELKFHHARIAAGSDSVTTIGQNIFILVGAGALIATQVREGVVLIPLFWAAWLLHSLQRGRDTLKHQVYARALEAHINHAIGASVLAWNRTLTTRRLSPAITAANFAFWGLLNLASWLTAFVVLMDRGHRWAAALLGVAWLAVAGSVAHTVLTNRRFELECEAAIQSALASDDPINWDLRYAKA